VCISGILSLVVTLEEIEMYIKKDERGKRFEKVFSPDEAVIRARMLDFPQIPGLDLEIPEHSLPPAVHLALRVANTSHLIVEFPQRKRDTKTPKTPVRRVDL